MIWQICVCCTQFFSIFCTKIDGRVGKNYAENEKHFFFWEVDWYGFKILDFRGLIFRDTQENCVPYLLLLAQKWSFFCRIHFQFSIIVFSNAISTCPIAERIPFSNTWKQIDVIYCSNGIEIVYSNSVFWKLLEYLVINKASTIRVIHFSKYGTNRERNLFSQEWN